MATRFAQQFSRTAVPNLIRQFGELIGYLESGNPCRDIYAIVERNQVAIMAEVGEVLTQSIIVRVANDDTAGILATKLDTGRDKVTVALKEGDEPSLRSIVSRLSSANGFVRFLVQ